VTYRHVGGLLGTTLVPDLATALPPPTNGGRTYVFKLREGIRYSNGQLVEPEDFRRALERVYRLPAVTKYHRLARSFIGEFYGGIVGADQCRRNAARCDLSRGIVADRSHTVTFHLTARDPDFLYKLAFAMADAVPRATPDRDTGRTPLPATGPYMTQSFVPGRVWKLVRNRRFHAWSPDAQPDGYPDRIVLRAYKSPSAAVTAIERGRADFLLCDTGDLRCPPPEQLKELATRYPKQLRSDPQGATYSLVMNTRVPPFDHVTVRRALNYAVDRGRVVADAGGPIIAQPTCQILPPTFAGYRPYCPYTIDPGSAGVWTAPDLAKAEQLVARSGTRRMKVTVLTDSTEPTGEGRALCGLATRPARLSRLVQGRTVGRSRPSARLEHTLPDRVVHLAPGLPVSVQLRE
jgi:peptide/nickel transport system substrate-binding protein